MPEFPDLDHWLPQVPPQPRKPAPPLTLRHPSEDDLADLEARLGDWIEDRGARRPGRLWFRHLAGTGWLAEEDRTTRTVGVLLGLRSVDRPTEAVIHLVAVDPEFRRRGIGRELVGRFTEQLAAEDANRIVATCRPDDRIALAFFGALGFTPDAGPGSTRLYGVPAYEDWDGAGEDRVLLERSIAPR